MPFNNGKYGLASRENTDPFTGTQQYSWSEVISNVPFIADLKSLFKYKPMTAEEKRVYELVKNELNIDDLLEHFGSLYLVEAYISFGHELRDRQFINLENSQLRMKYINLGHNLSNDSFNSLSESEMKRYFVVNMERNMERNEGSLNLTGLTSLPNNVKFPDEIKGDLNLTGLTSLPDNFKFPDEIGRDLNLFSLTSLPENFKFPDEIGRDLNLFSLKLLPDNVKFPDKIRFLSLRSLTSLPNNFKFPETRDGLSLFSLTSLPDDIKFPDNIGRTLSLNGLTSLPDNIKEQLPKGLKVYLKYKTITI
jgi:hypothetical protein